MTLVDYILSDASSDQTAQNRARGYRPSCSRGHLSRNKFSRHTEINKNLCFQN